MDRHRLLTSWQHVTIGDITQENLSSLSPPSSPSSSPVEDDSVLLPTRPSPPVSQFLFNLCKEVQRVAAHRLSQVSPLLSPLLFPLLLSPSLLSHKPNLTQGSDDIFVVESCRTCVGCIH